MLLNVFFYIVQLPLHCSLCPAGLHYLVGCCVDFLSPEMLKPICTDTLSSSSHSPALSIVFEFQLVLHSQATPIQMNPWLAPSKSPWTSYICTFTLLGLIKPYKIIFMCYSLSYSCIFSPPCDKLHYESNGSEQYSVSPPTFEPPRSLYPFSKLKQKQEFPQKLQKLFS